MIATPMKIRPTLVEYAITDVDCQPVSSVGSALLPQSAAQECRTPAGHPEGYLEALGNLYCNIARAIRQGNSENCLFPNADDGIEAISFVDKVVESHLKGNIWICMED